MASKEVVPQLGLDSYSCPHCGALAHQLWFDIYADGIRKDEKPQLIPVKLLQDVAARGNLDDGAQEKMNELMTRAVKNEITYEELSFGSSSHWRMMNTFLSRCHACDGFAIWVKDKIVWPAHSIKIEPHQDMPSNIEDDFVEAAQIVEISPRGSAALSRMILQKLMVDLGEKGDNINEDIASLVKKGLEVEIQQALDVVRVVGNNAVHPGKIDVKDNTGIAMALLQLINLVVERRIATQKRIGEMFANLPPGALKQIEDRDAPKLTENK